MNDTECDIETSFAWAAVAAKNTLRNEGVFSLTELFGVNVNLPYTITDLHSS